MDAGAVFARLSKLSPSDSRELDRACEDVAAALIKHGQEPQFPLSSADFSSDAFLICADRYWRQRFLGTPSVRTAAACARWLAAHASSECRNEITEKWTLGYAFITRDSIETTSELADAAEEIVRGDAPDCDVAYFTTVYHAGKLRSNFHFDELRQFLESSLLALAAGSHRQQPVFTALQAFAAFGSRSITAEHAITLLDASWHSPERTRHSVDVCLHALAFASPFESQGELLRERAQEAVRIWPHDHIFHFRLATGLHMCGDEDAALEAIEAALRFLPATGTRISHRLLQEQYLAKRDAILEGRIAARRAREQQRRWERQEAANGELEDALRNAGIRAVELVTLFTAAIAFAFGSLQIGLTGNMPLGDRIWLMVTMGLCLSAFAGLIVGGTWYVTRTRKKQTDD